MHLNIDLMMWLEFMCSIFGTRVCSLLKHAENRQLPGFTHGEGNEWNGSYTFIHGADPQFGMIDSMKGGNGTSWDEEIRLLHEGIYAINRMKPRPRFFFISGDLVHAAPGEEPIKSQQIKDLKKTLAYSEIPIFVISGNHDVGNTPSASSIKDYKKEFGDDFYSFCVGGVFYIALNSQYFYDSSEVGDLAAEQMTWLDQQLQRATSNDYKHVVVFMHIPPFLTEATENDGYFNIPTTLRMNLLNKYAAAGVRTVFSGHYHRNTGGVWTKTIRGIQTKIEVVVTSAIGAQLGEDKSGMSLVKVQEDEITQQYFAMEDLPIIVDL